MYGYIYKTTNLINGKIYIGQHKHSTWDEKYKGSGTLLFRAFEKYGFDNFKCELLESVNSQEELNEKEKFYIDKYNSKNITIGYNLADGGVGGSHKAWNKGLKATNSESVKKYTEKRNELFKSGSIGCFGLKGADNKNSIETKGIVNKILPEFEEYWRVHFKGEVISHFHTCEKAYNQCLEILNLDENDKERKQYLSNKRAKKRLASINKNGTSNKVKIKCIETGKIFNSILEARKYLGLNSSNSLHAALSDKKHTCRGYHWERV